MQALVQLSSLLDNDFYKFTMQHGVVSLFPQARARYVFINRGGHQFPQGFAQALKQCVAGMAALSLTRAEKEWLTATCPYLTPTYLDFLQGYRYNPAEVEITQQGPNLQVHIQGYWYRTILWEVPLMALICELYYKMSGAPLPQSEQVITSTAQKINAYNQLGITVAEFGTRRRHSYQVQNLVVQTLTTQGRPAFIGTSNMHFAMQYGVKPIGTHAHEWFMFHGAKYGYKLANQFALDNWAAVYRGDLGIALSDTYTNHIFFRQFDKMHSKLFDGVRHDSGDPILFARAVISHYNQMGINPKSKSIIFSDGLDFEKVKTIAAYCAGKINHSYGIGTNFTNDVGLPQMNIVIKMQQAQPIGEEWTDVVKLSDEPGKHTGTPPAIHLCKQILGIAN